MGGGEGGSLSQILALIPPSFPCVHLYYSVHWVLTPSSVSSSCYSSTRQTPPTPPPPAPVSTPSSPTLLNTLPPTNRSFLSSSLMIIKMGQQCCSPYAPSQLRQPTHILLSIFSSSCTSSMEGAQAKGTTPRWTGLTSRD